MLLFLRFYLVVIQCNLLLGFSGIECYFWFLYPLRRSRFRVVRVFYFTSFVPFLGPLYLRILIEKLNICFPWCLLRNFSIISQHSWLLEANPDLVVAQTFNMKKQGCRLQLQFRGVNSNSQRFNSNCNSKMCIEFNSNSNSNSNSNPWPLETCTSKFNFFFVIELKLDFWF